MINNVSISLKLGLLLGRLNSRYSIGFEIELCYDEKAR